MIGREIRKVGIPPYRYFTHIVGIPPYRYFTHIVGIPPYRYFTHIGLIWPYLDKYFERYNFLEN